MSRSLASYYKCQDENLLHIFRWLMQDKGLEYVERKAEISHSHILPKFAPVFCKKSPEDGISVSWKLWP